MDTFLLDLVLSVVLVGVAAWFHFTVSDVVTLLWREEEAKRWAARIVKRLGRERALSGLLTLTTVLVCTLMLLTTLLAASIAYTIAGAGTLSLIAAAVNCYATIMNALMIISLNKLAAYTATANQ